MRWRIILLFSMAILLATGSVALGQSSANYQLIWSVIAGGGVSSSSAAYGVQGTVGQALGHRASASSNYRIEGGFWPPLVGVAEPSPKRLFLPLILRTN